MRIPILLACLCAVTACNSDPAPGGTEPSPPPMKRADASVAPVSLEGLELPNLSTPEPSLVCAGQLSPEEMDELAERGAKRFISLRVATEKGSGWEEQHAAEKGYAFDRIPVAGADGIGEENARALRALLDATPGTAVVYCGSSNRVGALLGLGKSVIDGATDEEALEYAKRAGMTGLEPALKARLED